MCADADGIAHVGPRDVARRATSDSLAVLADLLDKRSCVVGVVDGNVVADLLQIDFRLRGEAGSHSPPGVLRHLGVLALEPVQHLGGWPWLSAAPRQIQLEHRFSRCAQRIARCRSAGVRVSVTGQRLPRPAGVTGERHRTRAIPCRFEQGSKAGDTGTRL